MKTTIKTILVAISVLISSQKQLSAQNDSLMRIINDESKHDTVRIKANTNLAISFLINYKYNEAEKLALYSISKSENIGYKRGMASANAILGSVFSETFNNKKGLEHSYKSIQYYRELNDTNNNNFILTLDKISSIYSQMGLYDKSIEAELRMLNICERINNNNFIIFSSSNLANIYRIKGDYNKAITHYERAYNLSKSIKDTVSYPYIYFGLGDVYSKKDFNKSLSYYQRYLNISNLLNDSLMLSTANLGIGILYKSSKQYDKAIEYLNKSLINTNTEILAEAYLMLGEIYYAKEKYSSSYMYFNKSLIISKNIELRDKIMLNYKNLSKVDSVNGNFSSAFENYKLYNLYKDSVFNVENEKNIVATEMNFSFDKEKAILKAKQDELNKVSDLKSERQRDIIIGVVLLLIIIAFVTIFIYKSYLGKNKAHKLISYQKHLVDEKQKEILDNITYAKRIQSSIIPTEEYISKYANSFVMYNPKDIVSGDFYWATEKDNKFYLATADCTGHGVSGAMVSMMNVSILNEVVNQKGITNTGEILNEVRNNVIKSLNPKGNEGVNDGMDCVLCAFDFNKKTLQYSASNNSFYIIRNKELIVCKADKMPIGLSTKMDNFTTNEIQLQSGDVVYMFTDGYADQFGGENNKKFKYKQLEETLMSVQDFTMTTQKNVLVDKFYSWMGNNEQTDDVLVIGIKID